MLGGLSAAVFVSLWYFFQNIDDEESRRIYGVASILSIGILVSLVNYIWGDRIAEWIPGGNRTNRTDFLDIVVSVHDCDDDG